MDQLDEHSSSPTVNSLECRSLADAHFRSMVEATGSAVICLSRQHRILYWNEGAREIFGYAPEEVLGRDYFELFVPPEYHPVIAREIEEVLQGKRTRGYVNPVRVRGGELRTLNWNATRLLDARGQPFAIVAVGQDITPLVQAEAAYAAESYALELLARGEPLETVLGVLASAGLRAGQQIHYLVYYWPEPGAAVQLVFDEAFPQPLRAALTSRSTLIGPAEATLRLKRPLPPKAIDADPLWDAVREAAAASQFRSSSWHPAYGSDNQIVAVIGLLSRRDQIGAAELERAQRLARLVAVVIDSRQAVLRRVRENESRWQSAVQELEALRQELTDRFSLDDFVAVSPVMLNVVKLAAQVAPTDATVLITGETGTGKEVLARAIHAASPRRHGPFVAVNCGAIPESLMESELFGHEKGAFTGADRRKPGQVERAQGGVLFLDEVAELTPQAQVKLLRLLQNRTFERLGGTETLHADVRVIAATNRDLHVEMAQGRFREDLYYRLNVFHIHLPPLRERRECIPVLAERLLKKLAVQMGRPKLEISPRALEVLQGYSWKGNIRELQNALERAAIVCEGNVIEPEHLPILTHPARGSIQVTGEDELLVRLGEGFRLEELERALVQRAMELAKGNKSRAARLLGLSRGALRWRLKQLGGGGGG